MSIAQHRRSSPAPALMQPMWGWASPIECRCWARPRGRLLSRAISLPCDLGAVEPEARKAPLSVFDLRTFDPSEPDEMLLLEGPEAGELVLTEKERLPDNPFERAERLLLEHYKSAAEPKPAAGDEEEPLLLDDILAELGPDSRVVRLFDRDAMPTPAELKSRIDRHLGADGGIPDAGQALNEALDELRRSIR